MSILGLLRIKAKKREVELKDINIIRGEIRGYCHSYHIKIKGIKKGYLLLEMDKTKGWGHNVSWFKYPSKIHGHYNELKKGDFITSKLRSGKTMLFRIKGIDYMSDPHDQFFADVYPVGDVKEIIKVCEDKKNE